MRLIGFQALSKGYQQRLSTLFRAVLLTVVIVLKVNLHSSPAHVKISLHLISTKSIIHMFPRIIFWLYVRDAYEFLFFYIAIK